MQARLSGQTADRGAIAPAFQRVVDRLRSDILDGLWRPDQRLKTRDLAAHYEVSTAPIREALQQLQGEGLVLVELNRGARVRLIDESRLIDIYDVREVLESYLTAKFAAAASPHQLSVIRAVQAEHDEAVDRDDVTAALAINQRLHRFINEAARNPEALEVIDRHLSLTRALRLECGLSKARLRAVRDEHHALIDAIGRGDAHEAGRLSALHVRSSRDDLVERLRPTMTRK